MLWLLSPVLCPLGDPQSSQALTLSVGPWALGPFHVTRDCVCVDPDAGPEQFVKLNWGVLDPGSGFVLPSVFCWCSLWQG